MIDRTALIIHYIFRTAGIAQARQHVARDGFKLRTLICVQQPVFRTIHIVRPGKDAVGLIAVRQARKFIKSADFRGGGA